MNFIELRVSGQNINLDEVTKSLKIIPKWSYKQGEGRIHKGNKVKYTEDCWIANIEIENEILTEEKMIEWIDLLIQRKEFINELSQRYDIALWITLYPETNQYHIHFSRKTLSKLCELNIDVGFSYMQLKEFYSGQWQHNEAAE